jgi:putative hydrolase of the HAD superfamily
MRALLLDIGGVFYRGWPAPSFWPAWSSRTGLSPERLEGFLDDDPDFKLASQGRLGPEEAYAGASERLGVSADTLRELRTEAFLSEPNQAMADFVRALRERGISVSALTNSTGSAADIAARPLTAGLFDAVISSRDAGAAKPDPRIFQAAIERLGRRAGEVVFVDDVLGHVEAARGLGFEAVHFVTTEDAIRQLERFWPQ